MLSSHGVQDARFTIHTRNPIRTFTNRRFPVTSHFPMPVPGTEIVRRIADFAASINGSEKDARARAAEVSNEIEKLLANQSDAFRELAQHYLPRLDDDIERDGWLEMRGVLRDIMLRRDDSRRQLGTRLQTASTQQASAEAQWKQLSEQFSATAQKADELAKQLTEKLTSDPELQRLSRDAAEAQARLEQATANLGDVELEAKTKLPPYEHSRLFQYLWDSEYDTERYRHRGMSRRIDRWLSRLIDYPGAAASYRFLTSAPGMMKQVIAEQEKAAKARVEEVQTRQSAAANALGLPDVQASVSRLKAEVDRAFAAMDAAQKLSVTLQHEQAQLDSPDSIFYRDALTAFQALLQKTERSIVAARAANTPELQDDQVVARLRHIDEVVSQKKSQLDQHYAAAEAAEKRTARVNDLLSRCRRAQFGDPQRIFEDSYDLTTRLNDLANGVVSGESMYQEMYRIQKIDSPIADQASAAINGPMGQILINTMAQAAGAALGVYAARAGQQHRLPRNRQ